MWKRIAPLLIALSVALNVGIGGLWLAHAVNEYRASRPIDENAGGVWCPLHRTLGVTEEQWRRLEPAFVKFRQESEALCREINRRRGELIDLIASSQPDRDAITAKQEEIHLGQQQMQRLVVRRLLAEKEVLTPEQQDRLFAMIRNRNGRATHGVFRGLMESPDVPPTSWSEAE